MKRTATEIILEKINKHYPFREHLVFTPDETAFLNQNYERVEVNKKELLIRQTEVNEYTYFVEKGIFRYWVTYPDGNEVTFWFASEGDFMNYNYYSKNQSPIRFNLESLTDGVIWRINSRQFFESYQTFVSRSIIFPLVMEATIDRVSRKGLDMLVYSAEERYRLFFEHNRELVLTVPLKYIASYLGITPQALSRIRKKGW